VFFKLRLRGAQERPRTSAQHILWQIV